MSRINPNRRKFLKFLGVSTAGALGASILSPIIRTSGGLKTGHLTINTSYKNLEMLLLETGKDYLPRDLYEATLQEINK
jgi:hypothetical protein